MLITLSPMRSETPLLLSLQGDCLTCNGEVLDLSSLAEGETLSQEAAACHWLASDVTRVAGQLRLTLILPHGPKAPPETRFPAPLVLQADGPVSLPAYGWDTEEI